MSNMTMREKIARAIGDVIQTHGQNGHLRATRPDDDMLNAIANTALSAMREPTDAMVEAFNTSAYAREAFRRMIDAAIQEKGE